MCRHSSARQALIQKIRDGAMGDIQLIRAYRMDPGYQMGPVPAGRMNCCGNSAPDIPTSSCGHPVASLSS